LKLPKQIKADQKAFDVEQNKGPLVAPRRFFNLLLLAGESGQEAQYTLFNLRYPIQRSQNQRIRRELINILVNLINISTTDSIIYNRLRSLAMSKKLKTIKESKEINKQEKIFNVLQTIINRIDEELQGVMGTQLASAEGASSKGTTTGIDAFSPILTKTPVRRFPLLNVIRRLKRRKNK